VANSQRDERGRFSSSSAPNGGGAEINLVDTPDARGAASSISPATDPAPSMADLAGRSSASISDYAASAAPNGDATAAMLSRGPYRGGGGASGGGGHAGAAPGRNYDLYPGGGGGTGGGAPLDLGGDNSGRDDRNDAAYRAGGYGDPAGEGPGQHQVQAPGGRAPHGSDVPGTGVAAPAEGIARLALVEAAAGGAEAAGAASGLAELAPLALAL
jgi:hypothetical protein